MILTWHCLFPHSTGGRLKPWLKDSISPCTSVPSILSLNTIMLQSQQRTTMNRHVYSGHIYMFLQATQRRIFVVLLIKPAGSSMMATRATHWFKRTIIAVRSIIVRWSTLLPSVLLLLCIYLWFQGRCWSCWVIWSQGYIFADCSCVIQLDWKLQLQLRHWVVYHLMALSQQHPISIRSYGSEPCLVSSSVLWAA